MRTLARTFAMIAKLMNPSVFWVEHWHVTKNPSEVLHCGKFARWLICLIRPACSCFPLDSILFYESSGYSCISSLIENDVRAAGLYTEVWFVIHIPNEFFATFLPERSPGHVGSQSICQTKRKNVWSVCCFLLLPADLLSCFAPMNIPEKLSQIHQKFFSI